ncbi:hypothetical protein Tco_0706640, partial [Tanacetum coccineum]
MLVLFPRTGFTPYPRALILGDPNSAVQTRSKVNTSSGAHAFKISEALEDESWVDAMQEELLQFEIQKMSFNRRAHFFLGFTSQQKEDGIFISQDKYVAEILKKFDFANVKTASTPIETQKPLVKDEEASDVDVHLYRSMIGSLMYLTASRPDIMFAVCACSRRLISWQCKKQTIVATSTTEAEYVAAASCCGQVLWIQNQMLDYGFNFMNTKIYIDNESTICIVKNPVYHSKTKHIAIRHHFIRDAYEKKLIQVLKIHTDDNVADLLTKAFDVSRGLKGFRELLSRATNGTEALLLPTLFFLWLDKVSTASVNIKHVATEKSEGMRSFMNHSFLRRSSFILPSLEVPIEHLPNPSPRPSPTNTIPASIPETSGDNLGGHSSSDKSLSGTMQRVTWNIKVSMDLLLGGRSLVLLEKVSTDRPIVSTDGSKVSTDRQIEGTEDQVEGAEDQVKGTDEHNEGTKEIFEGTEEQREGTKEKVESTDGQVKAKVLLNMSQAKAVSREKEKGVELNDVEETNRPKPTSTKSLLTLKPLPKIDPKDKGKKKIEEEDESESESDGIPQAEKKFKQLESDKEMARKIQEDWEEEEERNRIAEEKATNEALIRNFDD